MTAIEDKITIVTENFAEAYANIIRESHIQKAEYLMHTAIISAGFAGMNETDIIEMMKNIIENRNKKD